MPCQSYETSWADDSSNREVKKLKKEADKLARIACAALNELEENGIAEVLLLKNDELREWWAAHKEADRKERERVAEIERKERVRQEALDRLSAEEKELLGLTPPAKRKVRKSKVFEDEDNPWVKEEDYRQWIRESDGDYE